jgi:predicted RNA-binding protein
MENNMNIFQIELDKYEPWYRTIRHETKTADDFDVDFKRIVNENLNEYIEKEGAYYSDYAFLEFFKPELEKLGYDCDYELDTLCFEEDLLTKENEKIFNKAHDEYEKRQKEQREKDRKYEEIQKKCKLEKAKHAKK